MQSYYMIQMEKLVIQRMSLMMEKLVIWIQKMSPTRSLELVMMSHP